MNDLPTPSWRDLASGISEDRPGNPALLMAHAAKVGVELPEDYLAFMAESDGGSGEVGAGWVEVWDSFDVGWHASSDNQPYDDVLLFAGNGANTIYGFDARTGGIVEGDWIGLSRDEVIPRGRTFTEFLLVIADGD